jgi:altronate dehydratase
VGYSVDNAQDGLGARRPRALVLHARDNVAVAVEALSPGEQLWLRGVLVTVREPIAFGHKIALCDLVDGEGVVKYGEVIGIASAVIGAGRHVHVHNVMSCRLPGPGTCL